MQVESNVYVEMAQDFLVADASYYAQALDLSTQAGDTDPLVAIDLRNEESGGRLPHQTILLRLLDHGGVLLLR